LVTYGPVNFDLDAAVTGIVNPNSEIAAFKRFNPACTHPEVIIQNTGSTPLSSLEIEYWVEGGEPQYYSWNGNLDFLEKEQVELPIPDYSFWLGTNNIMHVQISAPNGSTDEYPNNDSYTINFETTDVYDIDQPLEVHCYTNNYANQTSYFLADDQGNIIFERDNLENTTLYTDILNLEPGCYKLRIDDSADDGLYYWYNTNQGSGYLRIKNEVGYILENIEPEFGRFAEYEFAIIDITGSKEIEKTRHISLYPNPAKNNIVLELSGYEDQDLSLEVLDPSQKIIKTQNSRIQNNKLSESIDIHDLNSGVYFIRITTNKQTFVRKFIKF
jgi:hypothetical protein